MLVRDYMTEQVFTLRSDKTLFVAQEIMGWAHVRHIPVVDREKRVVGMVSHRDILTASIASVSTSVANMERDQHLWTIPVEKVMKKDVRTISPEARIQEAARIMREEKIGCLAVVAQDKLVGILTEYDLLRIVEQL
jgi:predicted transcriptional regulator